jgi:phosphonate transport system substrate-binding protein
MNARRTLASWRALDHEQSRRPGVLRWGLAVGLIATVAACGSDDDAADPTLDEAVAAVTAVAPIATDDADPGSTAADAPFSGTLRIGAIPDQEPDRLVRLYDLVAGQLEAELPGTTVDYVPVTDYDAAVSGFAVGDLDLVWFGGLTGVQAQLAVEGAQALVQRDIDAEFTTVFIANTSSGVEPFDDVSGLSALEGHSFTFGSESSTSGRLMPQYFLGEAGLDIDESFTGEVGFSGSHDATIELVTAGTYETGALNSQVWDSRLEEGTVDTDAVIEVFRTPSYFDYHWVAQPDLDGTYGDGFTEALVAAFTSLDIADPDDAAILELFGATSFIPTENGNYAAIEAVGRDVGLIR